MPDRSNDLEALSPRKRELFGKLLEKRLNKARSESPAIAHDGDGTVAPLSFSQLRLWFINELNPTSSAYNIGGAYRLVGYLNEIGLGQAVVELFRRHEVLRASFHIGDTEPIQEISPLAGPYLRAIDILNLTTALGEASIGIGQAALERTFDLRFSPLIRIILIRFNDCEHILSVAIHHIISDALSMAILLDELGSLYDSFVTGRPSTVPEPQIQYADFARWQRKWLESDDARKQLDYWKERLSGAPPATRLIPDKPGRQIASSEGDVCVLSLGPELSQRARTFSQKQGVTPFILLLAVFQILLHRYTAQDDLVIGTAIANRNRPESQSLIGFLINTLLLRLESFKEMSFRNAMNRVKTIALEAYSNQDVPFDLLIEEMRVERDLATNPLFQVMFGLQAPRGFDLELADLDVSEFELSRTATRFDLEFEAWDLPTEIKTVLTYSKALFERPSMERVLKHFKTILGAAVASPDRPIRDISLMDHAGTAQVLWQWNATGVDFGESGAMLIPDLIELQASRTPDRVAVVFGEQHISFRDINSRAGLLGARICELGIGLESPVGVFMDRSIELVVALVSILKAGCFYVPFDTEQPESRLALMLEDADPPVVITQQALAARLPARPPTSIVCLETIGSRPMEVYGFTRPVPANALAYTIYTSGSTGQPKGAMNSHAPIVNRLLWAQSQIALGEDHVVLQKTPYTFDVSVWEFFWPLLAGARMVMANPGGHRDPEYLVDVISKERVTVIHFVPSMLHVMLGEAAIADCHSLRAIICSGEVLDKELAELCRARTTARVYNLYGPTEAAVDVTCYVCEDSYEHWPIPIGRPISNALTFILGRGSEPVPIGAPGELYIGGTPVGRGYFNRPDITAEKFLPNPFSSSGERLYNTGDLARYRSDGEIEYLGRTDLQIKLRGFRIEIGDVESALSKCTGAERAVALAGSDERGERRLIGYVVSGKGGALDGAAIRRELKQRLPEYMIPAAIVVLESLPLLPNGKIDRRALPSPSPSKVDAGSSAAQPLSELEEAISRTWTEVLKLGKVGLDDNFFDVGGHSLLLIRLRTRLNRLSPRELTILDLFKHTTVRSQAEFISQRFVSDHPAPLSQPIDLSKNGGTYAAVASKEIAIIGMAGRFPASKDVTEFWSNIERGIESISFFTDEQLQAAGVDHRVLGLPNFVRAGGALENIDLFDASFFGVSPAEARIMDPQQRLFLESAWQAMEDAGYDPERFPGTIGVYAGAGISYYLLNLYSGRGRNDGLWSFHTLLGNDKDHLATRVSYKLNLKGPSMTVQCGCSTSLVAVHLACQSLLNRECDLALAGGVSVGTRNSGYFYEEGGIKSPDGHCRAFDAQARGTVFGSGVGIVVLKRLDEAIRDGDNITAVIKGSSVNNDGSGKVGYTAPSISGQAEVIARAQTVSGVEPDTISYIEAHGTGTELGDPIEVAALTEAFRRKTARNGFCALGSVKTNVGHLDAAAGVAGLIKGALCLYHKQIPPSLHFKTPNPAIKFEQTPFYVNTELRDWAADSTPRRAGVSSFGIGGTNAHVLLEESPVCIESSQRAVYLLVFAAKSQKALDACTANLASFLENHQSINLADVAYTLQIGRKHFDHRRVLSCKGVSDAIPVLRGRESDRLIGNSGRLRTRPIAFMFPGQGSQYHGMGGDLYGSEQVFTRQLDRCAELFQPALRLDIRDVLFSDTKAKDHKDDYLSQTGVTQPCLFAVEYALARMWMSWGVRPTMMIGHSIGEYVAACIANVFSLEDATTIVAARGKLMQSLPQGGMLAVPLTESESLSLLNDGLWLAAVNSPRQCVISGRNPELGALQEKLLARGFRSWKLRTSHAFHSGMVDPILGEFHQEVRRLRLNPPTLPFVSNMTGHWILPSEATDPAYWLQHLRETVRFSEGVREISEVDPVFLEVGPGAVLGGLIRRRTDLASAPRVLRSLPGSEKDCCELETLLDAVGSLWLMGVSIDWGAFNSSGRRRRVPLPTYPFERKRYWVAPASRDSSIVEPLRDSGTGSGLSAIAQTWARTYLPKVQLSRRENWLVFADGSELSTQLVGRLTASHQYLVTVQQGSRFDKKSDSLLEIDPTSESDHAALVACLSNGKRLPARVIYLWPFSAQHSSSGRVDQMDQCMLSLLYFGRAFQHLLAAENSDSEVHRRVRLVIAVPAALRITGAEESGPGCSIAHACCDFINKRYPNLDCLSVELEGRKQSVSMDNAVDGLLYEALSSDPHGMVAYRGVYRWARIPTRCQAPDDTVAASRLKVGGVYLVVGDIWGPSTYLALAIAARARVTFLFLDWQSLPGTDALIAGFTGTGSRDQRKAETWLSTLDWADSRATLIPARYEGYEEIRALLTDLSARYGEISGLVYADPMALIDPPPTLGAFAALRSEEARLIECLLEKTTGDFALLCSRDARNSASLADITASASYDSLATGSSMRGKYVISVTLSDLILDQIPSAELGRVLDASLSGGYSHLKLARGPDSMPPELGWDSDQDELLPIESLSSGNGRECEIEVGYVAPRNDTERSIVSIWRNLLGVNQIGVDDDFYRLGGNSLLAITLANRLSDEFGVHLKMATLLDSSTVASLAAKIDQAKEKSVKPMGPALAPVSRERYRIGAPSNAIEK
jgi:amino acid adenylation domain-containing protein